MSNVRLSVGDNWVAVDSSDWDVVRHPQRILDPGTPTEMSFVVRWLIRDFAKWKKISYDDVFETHVGVGAQWM